MRSALQKNGKKRAADEIVPYRMGKRLYDALQVKKTLVTIDGASHNSLEYTDPHRYWSSIETFLHRYK